jgi:hypothetical protein
VSCSSYPKERAMWPPVTKKDSSLLLTTESTVAAPAVNGRLGGVQETFKLPCDTKKKLC